MIEPAEIDKKTRRLQDLLKAKFRIDADDLQAGMKKAGRRLPKRIHKAADVLIEAQTQSGNPKLALQADDKAVDKAFRHVEFHLNRIDVDDRRKGVMLGVLGTIALNLIVVFALFVVVLRWRGLV